MHGARSKTRIYAAIYVVLSPLFPIVRRLAPNRVTTTERIGRAMLRVARSGNPKRILESADIDALGAAT
jgi:hypothetical protein